MTVQYKSTRHLIIISVINFYVLRFQNSRRGPSLKTNNAGRTFLHNTARTRIISCLLHFIVAEP